MNKFYSVLILIPALLVFFGCEKSRIDNSPIEIKTNKKIYSRFDNIQIEIKNHGDSIAYYYVCSPYVGIPPNLYIFKENSWTGYWSPICYGSNSYCCGELQKGDIFKDTLNIELEIGLYRLEYLFIIRPSHEYESFYSETFRVEK